MAAYTGHLEREASPLFRQQGTRSRLPPFIVPQKQRSCQATGKHCQASSTASAEYLDLSAYSFPQTSHDHQHPMSLESAVRSAIGHLSASAFLQLQQNGLTSHHEIDDAILQSSQLREGLGQVFRESQAELVMLVHPLHSPEASQSARQVDADGNVMTGISNASKRSRLESFQDLLRRGGRRSPAVLSGSVGDCCDEEAKQDHGAVSQVVAFPRKKYSKYQQGQASSQGHSSGSEVTRYFGVILQSKRRADSGCYVLKTSESAVGDCTCTHWTLTRVSKDKPIFDQLCSAWLVQ